ncbi:MAG TPA: hypothetical protein VGV67_07560, partial [Solirubrobacteraceae bacterium]|nr:hypothetical protein [Solirubrobacteraceae bacterium]
MTSRRACLLALVAVLALTCSTAAAVGMSKRGDDRPNRITGTSKADRIYGRGGKDVLRGLGGRDRLDG